MPHVQSNLVEIRKVPRKGRGVFARVDIAKGTVIERAPVIELPSLDVFNPARDTKLASYVFKWDRDKDTVAIALGYGSLYNHSYRPNARFYDDGGLTQVFEAIRDIGAGEEITVNYNGTPTSRAQVGFTAVES